MRRSLRDLACSLTMALNSEKRAAKHLRMKKKQWGKVSTQKSLCLRHRFSNFRSYIIVPKLEAIFQILKNSGSLNWQLFCFALKNVCRNAEPRNEPEILWLHNLWYRCQNHAMEKKKTKQPIRQMVLEKVDIHLQKKKISFMSFSLYKINSGKPKVLI